MQTRHHAKSQLPFLHACRKRCQLDHVDFMFPPFQQQPPSCSHSHGLSEQGDSWPSRCYTLRGPLRPSARSR